MGIIIYLINHDNVPVGYLAERFHVSVRTIQRYMVSIFSIGIYVYAEVGKYGGYSVLPTYKIKNSDIRNDEQQMIIKASESLATSYTSDTLKALIEKYNAIIEKESGQKVFWDFGVTK
ncbi:MAG: HTH domain-containing protein [Butyrivibrio sp.]|nr:HTH domain-containing protein [Butyrivibrio sp.]